MSLKWKGGMAAAAFLLVSILAISPRAIAGDLMYGDADLSGAVNGGDLGLVQQCVSGNAQCPGNADASGHDCRVAASDTFALQKYLVFSNALPIKDPGTTPGCWCVSLSGPGTVMIPVGGSVPVTATLNTNVSPPRGGLDCAGIVVDFDTTVNPGGCTIDPSAVTDDSCNATATISGCSTPGVVEISGTVNLRDTGGGLLTTIAVTIPFTVQTGTCIISSVDPTDACEGSTVTITGTDFGAAEGIVVFDPGSVSAVVDDWTDTAIVVFAPGASFSNVTINTDAGDSCNLAGTYSYDNQAPTDVAANPAGGSYCTTPVMVSLSASEGTIYYTTDGSGPNTASPVYTGPIDISVDTILRFMAVDACGNQSNTVPELYDIDDVTSPPAPLVSPLDGERCLGDPITVTSADPASGGGMKCWGYNTYGQLGDGTTVDSLIPVDVSGLSSGMSAFSAGWFHNCAVTFAGGVKCWGFNYVGQLGDDQACGDICTDLELPCCITPVDVSGLTSGVSMVSAGYYHTCAVTSGGGVRCWGWNNYGQLGDGTNTDRATPVDVSGLSSGVIAVSAGYEHTCAVTLGGGVKCWGANYTFQLGDGTWDNSSTPVDVSGLSSGVIAISAGDFHTCALISGGGVKCWGSNSAGQLGDGTNTNRATPVDVSGLSSGVIAVSAGNHHTCALTSGGGVKCWGWNNYGQLGDGTNTDSSTPVDVSGLTSAMIEVSAGGNHTCALTSGGGMKCWGRNDYGQLGDGTLDWKFTPVDVSGLNSGAIGISASFWHNCALTYEGAAEHCTTDGSVPDCSSPSAPAMIYAAMTLRCIECDACGNLGAEITRIYTIDTVAVVNISSPTDGVTIYAGDVMVSGTADTDITTVTVTTDQGHSESSPVDAGGNWSVVLIGVTGSTMTITAQGVDDCSNIVSDSVTVPVIHSCNISSVVPTTGCPGDAVTITGLDFGPNTGTVTFNGFGVTVISWSDNSIIVNGPGGNHTFMTVMRTIGDFCSVFGNYSYDNVANVRITVPADGRTIVSNQCTVRGTADEDLSTVTVDGTSGIPVTGGNWTYTLSPCPINPCDAYRAINVSAMDACGNIGSDSVIVYVSCLKPICPCGIWPGTPVLIQSLPRNGAGNLPPDSVTKNMPVDAYLKFFYNQSLNISAASANVGNLYLEETNCGNDTLLWTATLDYNTDYNLNITGVVDCDEGNPVPDINLSLRTARQVSTPPGVQAQTGEGFLDGSLEVWVIDEMTQSPIEDAVMQINTTTSVGGVGYDEDVGVTGVDGKVLFTAPPLTFLNAPVMLTAMAPGYQYLTFAHLDARQIVMGLRHSGYGLMQLGDTQIIGDFDPAGFDTGVHPAISRNVDQPNPTRFGIASLGLHKRALNTLVPQDILAADVLQELTLIADLSPFLGAILNAPMPANIVLADFCTDRFDIPSMSNFTTPNAFFRLGTRDSGRDMYVELGGASCNIQNIYPFDVPTLMKEGSVTLIQLIKSLPITFSCGDIQRINVPALMPDGCQVVIIDNNNRNVTKDDCVGCNQCTTILNTGTRRMDIDYYNYGWSGNTATEANPTPAINEAGFTFDQAVRMNWSNFIYDQEKAEYWSYRIENYTYRGMNMPPIIPCLYMPGIEMDDQTIMAVGIGFSSRIYPGGSSGVASKLVGYPDLTQVGLDLGITGPWTMVPNIQAFDWEVRYSSHVGVDWGIYPGPSTNVPIFATSEWLPLTVGTVPADPGARAGTHSAHGISIDVEYDRIGPMPIEVIGNQLVDRYFEWYEVTATGGGNYSVIGDGADYDPVGHPGVDVDPEMNGEIVVMTLIDRCSTDPNSVRSGGSWGENYGSMNLGVWENTPIEPSYLEIWDYDRDGGGGGSYGEDPNYPQYMPIPNKLWRVIATSNLKADGRLSFYLPEVPTVDYITNTLGLPGTDYTFESLSQTGLRDDYIMEWEYSVMNMATNVTMQNFISPHHERQVLTQSQNRQNLIFRK